MPYRDDVDEMKLRARRDALAHEIAALRSRCEKVEERAEELRSARQKRRFESIVGRLSGFIVGLGAGFALIVAMSARG